MKTLFGHAFAAGAALCLAVACDSDAKSSADAAPAASWVELQPRERSVDAHISGLQLSADEKTLAFCTFRNEVGFIDVASLSIISKTDISVAIPEAVDTGFCRLTKRGDDAFALFYPAPGKQVTAIAQLSLAAKSVVGSWRVPDAHDVAYIEFFQTFEGLADAGDGRLLLTGTFGQKAASGTELHFFDPATGTFSSRFYPSDDTDVDSSEVVGAVAPGRIYGLSGHHFWLLDLETGVYTWINELIPKTSAIEADAQRGLMILALSNSEGWDLRRSDTGQLVKRLPYSDPAFDRTFRFMPGERVAYVATGSSTSYMSIMSTSDGRPLAKASFSGPTALDAVVTADGKHIYAGGTGLIADITVPDSL